MVGGTATADCAVAVSHLGRERNGISEFGWSAERAGGTAREQYRRRQPASVRGGAVPSHGSAPGTSTPMSDSVRATVWFTRSPTDSGAM